MENRLHLMTDWPAANPGKNDRDWLIEVRCVNDSDVQDIVAKYLRDKDFIAEEIKHLNSTK